MEFITNINKQKTRQKKHIKKGSNMLSARMKSASVFKWLNDRHL